MPDGRFVSKTIANDWELNSVSLKADYLFGRCIPHLDREGRLPGHAAEVKGTAVPLRDEFTVVDVDNCLAELARVDLVQWYEVNGRPCLQFPGFEGNQKGLRKDREAESRIPSPKVQAAQPITTSLRTNSGPTPDDSGPTPENSGSTPAEVEVEVEVEVQGKEPPRSPPTEQRGVDNSIEHTSGSLALEANQVLGLGSWFGDQGELHERFTETKELIWRNWLGRGVSGRVVYEAIHGLRLLVNEGRPEWLADRKRKPIDGLHALVNTRAVVPVGDGDSLISLFAAAVHRYGQEQSKPPPAHRGGGQRGPERAQVDVGELVGVAGSEDEEGADAA